MVTGTGDGPAESLVRPSLPHPFQHSRLQRHGAEREVPAEEELAYTASARLADSIWPHARRPPERRLNSSSGTQRAPRRTGLMRRVSARCGGTPSKSLARGRVGAEAVQGSAPRALALRGARNGNCSYTSHITGTAEESVVHYTQLIPCSFHQDIVARWGLTHSSDAWRAGELMGAPS